MLTSIIFIGGDESPTMIIKEYAINKKDFSLCASVTMIGSDVCIVVSGGLAHIGSVSIAEPRKSLKHSNEYSATVSTFNYIGHMDDVVGNRFATEVCAKLHKRTVVICGIHYDAPSDDMIQRICDASWELLANIIQDYDDSQLGYQEE